jgi:hypothetical protein
MGPARHRSKSRDLSTFDHSVFWLTSFSIMTEQLDVSFAQIEKVVCAFDGAAIVTRREAERTAAATPERPCP